MKYNNIVDIHNVDSYEHWVPVPSYRNKKRTRRFKKLHKAKGNCYFAVGVPHSIINFIYRSVVKLNLKDSVLIFSRGSVKINNISVHHAVHVCELDWAVGTSFIIPRTLRYSLHKNFKIDATCYSLRFMELLLLQSLLRLSYPHEAITWYSAMAACIIAKGWKMLDKKEPDPVLLMTTR